MKAIVMTQPGTPDVLQLQDVPQPQITQTHQLLALRVGSPAFCRRRKTGRGV
ncbi:MAG: hypothetical protein QNJ65_10870 [Xenococcaceae cyanobacterium MO_234.B1]|nr:hypothetical protein [Xenococcaceae cyanobacterium MO_234.B1]